MLLGQDIHEQVSYVALHIFPTVGMDDSTTIESSYDMFHKKLPPTPLWSCTFFCDQLIGKCDPCRICGFCTRVGLAISSLCKNTWEQQNTHHTHTNTKRITHTPKNTHATTTTTTNHLHLWLQSLAVAPILPLVCG